MASLKGLFKKQGTTASEMFETRVAIEKALYKAGFTVTGAGTMMDGSAADISIEKDGQTFFVDIKNLV